MNLSNRVAIVTGSGQGIGREIALLLAERGASVVVSDINEVTAKAVAAEIESKNIKSIAVTANVSSVAEVNKLVEQTLSSFGHVDILVNNAGITKDNLLMRMSEADWDLVLNINLKGAFLCTQAVIRHMMRQRWGRIVNIASVVGVVGNAGQANYAASKAGLIGLTKSTAREVASRGITVNAVAPGFIDTGMTQKLPENVKQEFLKQIPVGYFGLPKDVAHAVAFLVSEEAHYITGQVLNVNGGLAMI
ncbi:MAG: 3-oxoacyl-[acyl-carrier-protein] reductase [Candidatus Hadarchaeum sp.]